jgi:hypothetical protein
MAGVAKLQSQLMETINQQIRLRVRLYILLQIGTTLHFTG